MSRLSLMVVVVAMCLAGCAGGGATAPASPGLSSAPTNTAASPSAVASPVPTAKVAPSAVPLGRILFERPGSDGKEHYFTIRTDGSDERALFVREACGCAGWSGRAS